MCFYTHIGTKLSIVQALSVLDHQLAVCSCLLFYSQGKSESLIWKISKLLTQHNYWFNEMRILDHQKIPIFFLYYSLERYKTSTRKICLLSRFINPSLISRGRKIILPLGIKALVIISFITSIQFCSQGALNIMLVLISKDQYYVLVSQAEETWKLHVSRLLT